ncbi:MAG TPA: VIT and VWA domain-containing protein, partial [Vicinamibacteria bacterium]|nr:VIT and VWA domain-containing protein [Vicinamibacteria bacterium]
MSRRRRAAVVAVLSAWPVAVGAGPPEGSSETLSPYFVVVGGDEAVDRLPLLGTSVEVSVAGVIADVTVRQTYKNAGARPIHATYVFPASTRAAVHGLTLAVGEERIRARIREREQARREFEKARRESKTASLLEQERPNVFRMSVANVLPGDRIEVELRYSELLVPEAGVYEFVYPTVVGPRYSSAPAAAAPASERWIASPYTREGTAPTYTLALAARVSAGLPIADLASPSHRIRPRWIAPDEAEVALDASEAGGGDRDFVLRYRLTGGRVQSGLLLHAGEDEGFFLLTVQPPRRVEGADIPPREYVFVVDVSGSMRGFPLETAKDLLRSLIGELRPTDAFNLVFFAGGSRVLAPASLPAGPENVQAALRMLDSQTGGGGTELLAAVRRAMALPAREGTSRSLVVVTDGYVSAERDVFRFIRESLNGANVFAFGIGSSVNRHLIEGIARAGLGEPFVVLDPSEAPGVARRFREYVRAPVLTDVEVAFEGLDVHDLEPASIPDVLADRPVVVCGKWTGRPGGRVVVRGVSGSGAYRQALDVPAPSPANRALAWLWAKARVANLSELAFG